MTKDLDLKDFIESEITIGKIKFKVIHNLPTEGNINSIYAAIDNWQARTDNISAESFVKYINDKFRDGISDYLAMTEDDYKKIINEP